MWGWLNRFRKHPAANRLRRLAAERDDYQLFVTLRGVEPRRWRRLAALDAKEVRLQEGERFPLFRVDGTLVAYPNGQPVVNTAEHLPLPEGIQPGLESAEASLPETLRPADIEASSHRVKVEFGKSVSEPESAGHYSTTLTNLASSRIRVTRFAGFVRSGEVWKLHTATGQFFSAEEFRDWYGMGDAKWIEPGESVQDGNNFGGPPLLWAYFCESEDGSAFVAGGVFR